VILHEGIEIFLYPSEGQAFCPRPSPVTIALSFIWSVKPMFLSDFDYELPENLIAQVPLPNRTDSRLLHLTPKGIDHEQFPDLLKHLRAGDLLVLNDTQVVKARLHGEKDSGGLAEVLLERVLVDANAKDGSTFTSHHALCQVRVSKALQPGRLLHFAGQKVECVGREGEFYLLKFPQPVFEFLERHGELPLPPYIDREGDNAISEFDEARYQTVFANSPGAVAAPTAGLHFSPELLAAAKDRGVEVAYVTLHVGAGTFQPVRVNDVSEHQMHREYYAISDDAVAAIKQTKQKGGRVVAVGTTVIRTLESAAQEAGRVTAGGGETRLFIQPGFEFKVVDALVTNFHLPKSTLLMLVCAFAGFEPMIAAYKVAVDEGYRFFSYGDAMFIER
jgi:S-adenosylmethionine:tRNA ribosyltransferase-isomerase